MSHPLPGVAEFYFDGEPHLPPARAIDLFLKDSGLTRDEFGMKPVVIVTFNRRLSAYLAEQCAAERMEHPLPACWREMYSSDAGVAIITLTIGAPAAVAACEEMLPFGLTHLLVLAASGGLQPSLPIGSTILPETAIREERTSHHYLPPDVPARADPELLAQLERTCRTHGLNPPRGLHWTTDAIYREHREKIARYQELGVTSVDMEISALYALGAYRDFKCAAAVVISDELFEPYRLGFRFPELVEGMGRAGLAALAVAQALAVEASADP
ncbi:MAG TPA: nucleoside phosphorylase [Dehalococcoidia bacterium]|nr:nucleoside phosphorylase [Dehalococcoidia bacterium]